MMDECKAAIKACIDAELAKGTRKANIEIELIHHIRRALYERND
jgi:alpha-D-ribose 1-methylphosphonate 5-triphosphate synthase subunit PhnG